MDTSYTIYRPTTCSPCHISKRSDCKHGLFCLTDITVDAVCSKVIEAVLCVKASRKNNQSNLTLEISESRSSDEILKELISSIVNLDTVTVSDHDLRIIAESIASSISPTQHFKHLFVDISVLVHIDSESGIQRVVRSILRTLLENPPDGYVITPVYADMDSLGYFHAERFIKLFLRQTEVSDLVDEPISFNPEDIFLGLDLCPQVVTAQKEFLWRMRRHGVQIKFVVYDLLSITMPQCFIESAVESFRRWLYIVAESDGAVCISNAVAEELTGWLKENGPERLVPFNISWFHLGADIESSAPSLGLPDDADEVINTINSSPSFLMVGTIEPRKGQAQALAAFEQLWSDRVEANLVIVGKRGWMVESLVDRLDNHPMLNNHLFWLEGISDEYLEKVYDASTCLIAASEGEGFGLPLIEAAQHKKSIIARDIPVFREVAGEHAFYFDGSGSAELATAIKDWLALYQSNRHPRSDLMPWLTWSQSAAQLLEALGVNITENRGE